MARKVSVLGTGLMGAPMARNLLRAGHKVTVWNRSPEKAEALAADGAVIATSAADAVAGAEFVITMLSDGSVTQAVLDDPALRGALTKGAVWIEMSSVKPAEARAQSVQLEALGVGHIDAPVSGGTKGAEDGTLAIMVGGPSELVDAALPVLSAMGRPVHVGPSGAGQLAKLANQAIVAVTIGAVAEAMLLIERGGGDPAAVRTALKGGFADSTILQQHGARMTEGDFVPGGLARSQIKDLDNALGEAQGLDLVLPVTEHIRDRFVRLRDDLDGGDLDHSALYLELRDLNGLEAER